MTGESVRRVPVRRILFGLILLLLLVMLAGPVLYLMFILIAGLFLSN